MSEVASLTLFGIGLVVWLAEAAPGLAVCNFPVKVMSKRRMRGGETEEERRGWEEERVAVVMAKNDDVDGRGDGRRVEREGQGVGESGEKASAHEKRKPASCRPVTKNGPVQVRRCRVGGGRGRRGVG